MKREDFQEQLLSIMEQKDHWAWPSFTGGRVAADRLHIHLEQEYAVYVRDFPVLVGWAYVRCPIPEVRRELVENIFEEETGGLVAGKPHPDLFLEYPRGLGMDMGRFEAVKLLPEADTYRSWLDQVTRHRHWAEAAAVTTLFLEGTKNERCEVDSSVPRPKPSPLEEHPLVKHYGLPLDALKLTKAHRQVEGEHRAAAWRIILDHVPTECRQDVCDAMGKTLALWQGYRDGVAAAVGLAKP